MMDQTLVSVLIGSLRKESFSRKVAQALIAEAPASLECRIVEINDLPMYNEDLDARPPEQWTRFRDAIRSSRAVLFVTPEYNRSIPGALKNAIDWASRPWGTNSFSRKPSAIIGTSPGKIGTAVGQQHLRSILAFCNSPLMNAIEAYIEFTPGLITDDGEVTVDSIREFLANYMKEYHAYITRVYTAIPRTTGEYRTDNAS